MDDIKKLNVNKFVHNRATTTGYGGRFFNSRNLDSIDVDFLDGSTIRGQDRKHESIQIELVAASEVCEVGAAAIYIVPSAIDGFKITSAVAAHSEGGSIGEDTSVIVADENSDQIVLVGIPASELISSPGDSTVLVERLIAGSLLRFVLAGVASPPPKGLIVNINLQR